MGGATRTWVSKLAGHRNKISRACSLMPGRSCVGEGGREGECERERARESERDW
jgi:hypothetical protein